MNISRFLPCLLFILICQYLPVAGQSPDFITTWKTDNPGTSNSTSIAIPTFSVYSYSYDVDWENDGVWDDLGVSGDITHDYGTAGTYTVAIRGTFPTIFFLNGGDKDKILSIDNWGLISWESFSSSFFGCGNLVCSATDAPDLSLVSNMSFMFKKNSSLTGDFSNWDVSNVTQMVSLFSGCLVFNSDVSAWDVSNVTNMHSLFRDCSVFNSDVSGWDVSNVTSMAMTFAGCNSFNSDVSGWDMSSVTDMNSMFRACSVFNSDLSAWDVSAVTDINSMFWSCDVFNSDLSGWDVSAVTNMEWMFKDCHVFNSDVSGWDVSAVTDMSYMFDSCNMFNSDISGWDVSAVTNMSHMFANCDVFNSNVSSWDVSAVTDMNHMFRFCEEFNSDISGWDVSAVTDMWVMFEGCVVFNSDVSSWDVSAVTDMMYMFRSCDAFNSDVSAWDVSAVTKMWDMFGGCDVFNSDVSGWDVSSVTNMRGMFADCDVFNSDVSAWDVSAVTNMSNMFTSCDVFNSDISGWDVSEVTNMSHMFANCDVFNSDLTSWDVSAATDMSYMFWAAISFDKNLGSWNLCSVQDLFRTLGYSGLSVSNYDQTLMGWASQIPPTGLTLSSDALGYCLGEYARDSLINVYGWSIQGDNMDCSMVPCHPQPDVISSCGPITWIDGNTYTSNNNTATMTLTGSSGCDSIVTLNLTINSANTGTEIITSCDSLIWIDGNTYTSNNNTATHTLINSGGCDSIVTLDLTINSSSIGTDIVTSCDSLIWIDGHTYNSSNNKATHTLVNAQGCDSVVTLDLTIESTNSSLTQAGDTLIADLAGATYQWLDCNNSNSPIAGETSQSFSTTSPGNYAVEVSTVNCNAISDCYFITGVGVQTVFAPGAINVYPNPSRGQADVSFPKVVENLKINLLDLNGRIIEQFQYAGAKEEVSLQMTDVPNGVYFLQMTFEGGSHQAKLIVIR